MKILIGTKNPGKIEGAKQAFKKYFKNIEIEGISVDSEVGEQPVNEEIYQGAKNRVKNLIKYAKQNDIKADYYIAIESGITDKLAKWMITNIAVIENNEGFESWGSSCSFPVPDKYVKEIIDTDLGKVMDRIFDKNDLRSKKGGINLLTHNEITRINLTQQAFIMALTQFINNEIWK